MHLYVAISSHGFGHLAQTAPVINELRRRLPGLSLTVRCALPRERIAQRVEGAFDHEAEAGDVGLIMLSALDVDVPASLAAYRAFHQDWVRRVDAEAARLAALRPDLVLSNVSYLALAAARRAGLPAVALGSLNWAAITAPYFRGETAFVPIESEMREAYQAAESFLRPTPGLPMADLPHVTAVGPVAQPGASRRAELPPGRLVLVAMGGVGLKLPEPWPRIEGVTWIVPRAAHLHRPDTLTIEDTGLSAADLIASVDCVLTKPGYGTFVEAAACGTPLVYVRRPDWPEEPVLAAWHARLSRGAPIERDCFERGAFGPAIAAMLEAPRPAPVPLTGVNQAADWLAARLLARGR